MSENNIGVKNRYWQWGTLHTGLLFVRVIETAARRVDWGNAKQGEVLNLKRTTWHSVKRATSIAYSVSYVYTLLAVTNYAHLQCVY